MAPGGFVNTFSILLTSTLLILTQTDRTKTEQRLTEGEDEGIKANLAARWDLSNEPLCDATDGH